MEPEIEPGKHTCTYQPSPTRRVVPADLVVQGSENCVAEDFHVAAAGPVIVSSHAGPQASKTNGNLIGLLGLIVVTAIMGSCVYLILKYLLNP